MAGSASPCLGRPAVQVRRDSATGRARRALLARPFHSFTTREAWPMTSARPRRRAIALSSFDVPGEPEHLLHACEDCACAVTDGRRVRGADYVAPLAATDGRRWVSGTEVADMPLDYGHRMLFNPAGRGGVVVVNDDAH